MAFSPKMSAAAIVLLIVLFLAHLILSPQKIPVTGYITPEFP
jgi:hypothetical protein